MIRFGQVTEVQADKGLCRVNFKDDDIVSFLLPVLQSYTLENKASRVFDINEYVACLMDEDCENGVVLGAVYNTGNSPTGATSDKLRVLFKDGALFEYDRATHELKVTGLEKITIVATGAIDVQCQTASLKAATSVSVECLTAEVKAATSVKIDTPLTEVTGLLKAAAIQTAPGGSFGGGLAIQGDVTVTGTIDADGQITSGGIGLTSHKHGGVQTGGGTSGVPVP